MTQSIDLSAVLNELTVESRIADQEATVARLAFLPTVREHTLYCQYTGVPIAKMEMVMQAGRVPYLKEWQQSIVVHPLFSMPASAILAWTRKNWNRIFRTASDHATDLEKQQFQIAFVACLHTLGSIKQEVPILPSFDICQQHLQHLLELAYWHHYLDSKRFKFPTLRINKQNSNANLKDIGVYFAVCDSVRTDWETKRDAHLEDAKLEIARKVEKLVRGSHIRAVSKRALWNWFIASIMAENRKQFELDEWKEWRTDSEKLWFASENQQLQFSLDDVQSIEDVFIRECTLGTTISHTFQKELNKIRENISNHLSMWSFDWADELGVGDNNGATRVDAAGNILSAPITPTLPGTEPQLGAFRSRFEYLRAHATWKLDVLRYSEWQKKYGTGKDAS